MKEIKKHIIELLYPRRCPICEKIVLPKGNLVCKTCYEELPLVTEPYCMKCGKSLEQEEREYCFDCQKREFSYEYGFGLWMYDKKMQKSMAAFKYRHKRENCDFYVQELVKEYESRIHRMQVDAIVPVPMYRNKMRMRGYNQAELLARGLGEALGIEVEPNLLLRTKNTIPQKKLNVQDRMKNLAYAFTINNEIKNHYRNKNILLIDDIYTTGSTIEVCSKMLRLNGVSKVYYISLCIGKGY